jgi:trigger factor
VEVEREILSVVDEDVQQQLDQIRESHGKLTPVEEDRPVREDDYVILEYEGFENDRPIEGIKSANFLLKVGSGDFHPAFESGLIGMRKGTDGQIHVQFEEDFRHARLAGRSVSFRLKVLNIKTLEVPDLDDAFALSLGSEFQDLASLKSKINETLTAQEEKRIDRELKQNLIQKIADTVDFELPQVMVDTEVGYALETIRQNLQRSGSSFEKAGLSEERVRKDLRPASEKRVKNMLILSEIARRDAIAVEAEDLRKGFEEMAASTGQDPETIKKYYEARGMTESFEQKLLEEKTLNYLVEHAKILDVAKHAEAQ